MLKLLIALSCLSVLDLFATTKTSWLLLKCCVYPACSKNTFSATLFHFSQLLPPRALCSSTSKQVSKWLSKALTATCLTTYMLLYLICYVSQFIIFINSVCFSSSFTCFSFSYMCISFVITEYLPLVSVNRFSIKPYGLGVMRSQTYVSKSKW